MKDATIIVLAFVMCILLMCAAVHSINVQERGYELKRIDWDKVPVEIYRLPPKRSENQQAFARERKREYAALEFERTRHQPEVIK